MVIGPSGKSGELEGPGRAGVAVAVQDGVEFRVSGVSAACGKEGSGVGVVGGDVVSGKEDVFSADGDGILLCDNSSSNSSSNSGSSHNIRV